MEGEINFTKIFIILFVFVGTVIYIRSNYTYMDVLAYSEKHPHPSISPRVEYWIGRAQYHRDVFPESHQAFDQMLKDYPTCQYAPDALYYKGLMYSDGRKFAHACLQYEKYMKMFPEGKRIRQIEKKHEFIKFKK